MNSSNDFTLLLLNATSIQFQHFANKQLSVSTPMNLFIFKF